MAENAPHRLPIFWFDHLTLDYPLDCEVQNIRNVEVTWRPFSPVHAQPGSRAAR